MNQNVIPQFIMMEWVGIVNDIPNMHCSYPTIDDHCIYFKDTNLKIPLQLNGVFSYFHTRKPSTSNVYGKYKIFLTPDSSEWNNNCESYSHNESIMTNYEGDITSVEDQNKIPMEPAIDPNEIFEMANL